jgi:hypothetical protein
MFAFRHVFASLCLGAVAIALGCGRGKASKDARSEASAIAVGASHDGNVHSAAPLDSDPPELARLEPSPDAYSPAMLREWEKTTVASQFEPGLGGVLPLPPTPPVQPSPIAQPISAELVKTNAELLEIIRRPLAPVPTMPTELSEFLGIQ